MLFSEITLLSLGYDAKRTDPTGESLLCSLCGACCPPDSPKLLLSNTTPLCHQSTSILCHACILCMHACMHDAHACMIYIGTRTEAQRRATNLTKKRHTYTKTQSPRGESEAQQLRCFDQQHRKSGPGGGEPAMWGRVSGAHRPPSEHAFTVRIA